MSTIRDGTTDQAAKKGLAKKMLGGAMKLAPLGMNVAFPAMTYLDKKEEGWSTGGAAIYAGGELALWTVMPGIMMGATALSAATEGVKMATQFGKQQQEYVGRMYSANFGGNYIDSQYAGTMRQAGMYSISQSKGSIQSRLGSEAKSFYRKRG